MFEFGWAFWVLFFAVFFGCGRMCGWGRRGYYGSRRHLDEEEREGRGADRGNAIAGVAKLDSRTPVEPEPVRLSRPQETPLKALQRDFVDGAITMDEYERRLDAIERL